MDKILMVDQYQSFLEALRQRFKSELEILPVRSGKRALEYLEENSDIRLVVICPDVLGWKQSLGLVQDIRKMNSQVQILALAQACSETEELLEAGCDRVIPRFRTSQTIEQMLTSSDEDEGQEEGKLKIFIVIGREDAPATKLNSALQAIASRMSLAVEIQTSYALSVDEVAAGMKRVRPQILFLPRSLDNGHGNDVALWIDENWREPIKVASYGPDTVEEQRLLYQGCRCVSAYVDTYYEQFALEGARKVLDEVLSSVE